MNLATPLEKSVESMKNFSEKVRRKVFRDRPNKPLIVILGSSTAPKGFLPNTFLHKKKLFGKKCLYDSKALQTYLSGLVPAFLKPLTDECLLYLYLTVFKFFFLYFLRLG